MQFQPHILLAEDDADTREIITFILNHAGFRVSVTGDSSEVIKLLANDSFDFCSGAVTEADKKAAFQAGAQGYLSKPIDPDDLTATLRTALNWPQDGH